MQCRTSHYLIFTRSFQTAFFFLTTLFFRGFPESCSALLAADLVSETADDLDLVSSGGASEVTY